MYIDLYHELKSEVNNITGIQHSLLSNALEVKLDNLRKDNEYKHTLYDKCFFTDIKRKSVGIDLNCCYVIGSPLSREMQEFLSIVLSCPVSCTYTIPNTNALLGLQLPQDPYSGYVLLPKVEVKLTNLMEGAVRYSVKVAIEKSPLRGDICIKGNFLFQGFFKGEDLIEDFWLYTGDIGDINEDGSLAIIEKKKDFFKVPTKGFVALRKIENICLESKYISDIIVYGGPDEDNLVAIVLPNKKNLVELGRELKLTGNLDDLSRSGEIKFHLVKEMNGRLKGLENCEDIDKIQIENEPQEFLQFYNSESEINRDSLLAHYAKTLKKMCKKVRFN
jgi:long-chain acyl-CoA synthetase